MAFKKATLDKIINFKQPIYTDSSEEKVKLLIIRDLVRLGWKIDFLKEKIVVSAPKIYEKNVIREMMLIKRNELIKKNISWIQKNIDYARENLANGDEVLKSEIIPEIEVCETPRQHALFRILRYYWSSPYTEYVGRRIKLIVRDAGLPNKPVIGIIALGSPIIHIPDRDLYIGWDKEIRTNRIIYTMDAYTLGSLPPYNYFLGGKLLCYILASNKIRKIYAEKYRNQETIIKKRKANDLVAVFVTSLYGRSSQYNRIKYKGKTLFYHIGETKGYGSFHLSEETFMAMNEFLKENGIIISNRFGDGPSWKMRVIRTVSNLLNFDSDFLLRHSFRRWIYILALARNYKKFLQGKEEKIDYVDYPFEDLVTYWRNRWLNMRKRNEIIIEELMSFRRENFLKEEIENFKRNKNEY